MEKLKIAWIHNFSINIKNASGVFMYQLYDNLKNKKEIEIELINIGTILNPFIFALKYFKHRKAIKKFDIVHAQYGSGTGFFVSLLNHNKVLSLRGSDWYVSPYNSLKERLYYKLGNLLTKLSIKKFNQIIVMSERMKYEICKKYPKTKTIVIPDGLNLSKFYPIQNKSNEKYRILFSSVTRGNKVKRYELAEAAYDIFHKRYPNSELVFMTDIPHSDVNMFINSCNVVLLTSTHEGWPNIIKEALACNIPFVSTDVSDLKKIANETDSCFICEPNEDSLAEGLEKAFLNNKKDPMLREIAKKFEIGKISERLVDLYKKLS